MLINEIHQARWNPQIKVDGGIRLITLFYASLQPFDLLGSYPNALLMDCNLKTNGSNIPLLYITEKTTFKKFPSIVFAPIKKEYISDYK